MQEMKNALDGINSRLNIVDKKITKLEDITIGTIQNETKKMAHFKKAKY